MKLVQVMPILIYLQLYKIVEGQLALAAYANYAINYLIKPSSLCNASQSHLSLAVHQR